MSSLPPRALHSVLAATFAVLPCTPASAQDERLDPGLLLARVADANVDGAVESEEWSSWLATLEVDEEGVVDRQILLARLLLHDVDGDGQLTTADIEQVLGADGPRGGMLAAITRQLADGDEDGTVDEAERGAFVASAGAPAGERIADPVLRDWMQRTAAIPPAQDPNALNPGVIVLTIDSMLDVDASGRVTNADIERWRLTLDADSDGRIDASELEAYRRALAGPGSPLDRWAIDEDAALRPPLIAWQRNLDDALAVSKATGKPLLLAVNVDGESASESLAWGRYRNEDFAELTRGFVPLIASPDVHAKAEHDDLGRRIPDPRFGRVLDSEHIAIEPLLFERFFDGRRVAPRHVGVSPEGEVLFDVFLVQDLVIVDEKLAEFGRFDSPIPDPSRSSEAELASSPEAGAREEYEARFQRYDAGGRASVAARSLSNVRGTQHPEILRMSLRDPDPGVREAGLQAMLNAPRHAPLELLPRAVYLGGAEYRASLVDALTRAAAEAEDAAAGAALMRQARFAASIGETSSAVDVERWRIGFALAPQLAPPQLGVGGLDTTARLLEEIDAELAEDPGDIDLLLARAAGFERLARTQIALQRDPSFFLEDVLAACKRALAVHSHEGRALGLEAWAHYMLSDMGRAGDSAAHAVKHLIREAGTPLALEVMRILARARASVLYEAMAADESWPRGTIADVVAAHEALLAHPSSGEAEWIEYLRFLEVVQAWRKQHDVARRALRAHPQSADLHSWLRWIVLRAEGAQALEAAYDSELFDALGAQDRPAMQWFRGLAVFVAAERDVACRDPQSALARYARGRASFAGSVEARPEFAPTAAHYQALALAAEARLLAQAERWSEAADSLVASYRTAPGTVTELDGLDKSPQGSAAEILRALRRAEQEELAAQLETRLAEAVAESAVPAAADEQPGSDEDREEPTAEGPESEE